MMINLTGEEVCALRHAIEEYRQRFGMLTLHGKALITVAEKINKQAK